MEGQLVFEEFYNEVVHRLEQTIDLYKAELEAKDEEIKNKDSKKLNKS